MSQGSTRPRVAIIGGGIGGLTLANALQKEGWDSVTVFEQWTRLKSRGGTISIMPEALGGSQAVLEALGLDQKVASLGMPLHTAEASCNGRVHTRMSIDLGIRVMREALQTVLLENLAPGTICFGMTLCGFVEHVNGVELQFESGLNESFDLVVAADGINSTIAAKLFPESGSRFAGTVVYVCLARGGFMPAGTMYENHIDCGSYGFSARAVSGSGFGGRWDTCAFVVRSDVPVSNHWDSEGTKEQIRPLLEAMRQYGGCPDWLVQIVEESDRVMRWGVYEHGVKPSWISPRGRLVLLGDAAHAMAPYGGTGAQAAMLDAHELAKQLLLDQPLAQALSAYEAERKAHCEQMLRQVKFEGVSITSSGVAGAYRRGTMGLMWAVRRNLVHSSKWYARGIGAFLLKLVGAGFLVAEAASTHCCFPVR